MMEIILATTNRHKFRELREMFKPFNQIELLSLHHFKYEPIDEIGSSFKENSILKAKHYAKSLHKWVLADDSGLVVPALGGEPGIFSARYAGKQATDLENQNKLLLQMKELEGESRIGYYECCLTLANPSGDIKLAQASCEGHIAGEPRGRHGFGYDPLFVKNDYEKTFGELDDSIKLRISHRRKAFERLLSSFEMLNKP
jgi:XTP/dITP diphosphohydrolase